MSAIMNNTKSARKKKEDAVKIVKEMMQRKGDGLADQKILDHYRTKKTK